MSENNLESLPFAEVKERTFAQDCVELANIFGVEQLVSDFNFDQDPTNLLTDLSELIDIGVLDQEATPEKNVQRAIANIALLTFYDRIPSFNDSGEKFADTVDNIARSLETAVSEKMKYFERLAGMSRHSIEEHFALYPRDRDEITRLRNASLNDALSHLNLDFSKDTSDPQRSFLRVPTTEGVDQNCIYFTAVTMSTALRMGIPETDVKMFLVGYHGGALIDNFPYSDYFGIMDLTTLNQK